MPPRYPEDYEVMGGTDRYRVEYDAYGEGCLVLWCVDHGSVCTWPGAALVRDLTALVRAHDRGRHADG
jgi:hypothetical protein